MNITQDTIVALIGAFSAILGAIFSTVSIILSNKNAKRLKWLENSEYVKKNIAIKRYSIYESIIEYINSFYDIEHHYKHDYKKCKARLLSISITKLSNKEKIIEEYQKIQKLSKEYFYLDKKSYWYLKGMEMYLDLVIKHMSTKTIENLNLFSIIVYKDLWKYILKLSKPVNKFISNKDLLKFTPSRKFNDKFVANLFYKTDFYKLFYVSLIDEKVVKSLKFTQKKANVELKNFENLENKTISSSYDKKKKKQILKDIKKAKKLALDIIKEKPSKKIIKNTSSKVYKMWKNCITCNNKDCPLHKNSTYKKFN